ncbi:MAG: metal-dependent hydrolase [Rhodothermales bacterium]|nr:metal-dependent hydrolase [Rhodothermales bacterium]MBO6779571.1 metal-dependent hydrolase [Rhodothermales bacterium]
MKLTYYGHSVVQIETADTTILVDPFISGNPHVEGIVVAGDFHPDVILITHAHGDHWGDTEDIARRTNALVVANHEIVTYLSGKTGHQRVHGMNVGGAYTFPWGTVKQTLARHSSSFPDGTYGGNPNGYLLTVGDDVVYLAGDTAVFAEMAWIGEDHDIDVAFLPIGDCYTMGPEDAVRAAGMLKPAVTVPVHYNTFPPIEVDVASWLDRMVDAGHRGHVLRPGETLSI